MTTPWPLRLRLHQISRCISRSASRAMASSSSSRTYADAVAALNTLQSNFAVIDAIRKSGRKMNDQAIPEMQEWCRKIGYEPREFDRLNIIHIAGTKGKGSTAAFVSSILSQYLGVSPEGGRTKQMSKIGLYTSPHLRFVRERIQINGRPLSEEQFARYFFETWDRLESAAARTGGEAGDTAAKPVYFRFLTLMAFHTYMSEGVDAAVIECGIGGAYDSTNIIERPAVTGITSLGIDHVGVLGGTLEEIAWHKAGIMKEGVKCFTPVGQRAPAIAVMAKRAREAGAELVPVETDPAIAGGEVKLGLQADFQKTNSSLAVAMAREWLAQRGYIASSDSIDDKFRTGLAEVRWGGRCETRRDGHITWCIDGGHTLDSIELAGAWFATQIQQKPTRPGPRPDSGLTAAAAAAPIAPRFLIFNQQTRDADALARALHATLVAALGEEKPFTHAVFCTNTTFRTTGFRPDLVAANADAAEVETLKVQNQLARTWAAIDPDAEVSVVRTIEEAVELVRREGRRQQEEGVQEEEVMALVTGSLHLVGGFLEVIETERPDDKAS